MANHPPQPVQDYTTANLILIFVNLLWIFLALWSAWGLGPVLILGAFLNHGVTRIEAARRAHERRFERFGGPSSHA
ncbi:histidinol phosphate aminotransferase [Maliponia aquimaris]|uniref:Histidinol phosphate aminotransferase n=1 Tax=Maliponia aquimaris TaxID=1673631 RepID=A0A238KI53_9RHOB|nr:histidinol phosphate aminotransferase [Maliponia aquimaris]SMX42515.1 hypothetical protein MAA8898_02633 [Maliponia aquimaris]